MPMITVKNYKGVEVEQVKNTLPAKNVEVQIKNAIIDKVLEENDIEIPQDLIENEITRMVDELKYRMRYESMATCVPIDFTEDEMIKCMEEIREEAFKQVKTKLILEGIIEAESFEITKKELEEEAKEISVRQQVPIEMLMDFLGEDLELLKNDLMVRKAINFIYDNAVITY